ncbi:MAG: glycosyltransferase family 4 protein [Rhizomicrobium sp.]
MTQARVLHVFKYFRPQFTGEGIFVERLAHAFARLRPDVAHDVAVTATRGPANPLIPEHLSAVHYLSGPGGAASQREIAAWLARHGGRYTAVHYHTHVDRTFAGSLMLKLRGCRLILSATLDDSIEGLLRTYRPRLRPLIRRLFRAIDQFVAISPKLFSENNRYVCARKSALIPIGIAIPDLNAASSQAAREKLSIDPQARVLVSVGGICARKDQLFLVQQLAELVKQHPNLLLILVGPDVEPEYAGEVRKYVTDHGLERHVRFAGYAESPWDFYTAADIMVFASHEEGFGTVVIEAMAHGLPVVARHLPGVNDTFVKQGVSGFLFTESAEFQPYLNQLLGDDALRRRVGGNGRDFVAENYNIADIAGRYLALYGFPAGDKA